MKLKLHPGQARVWKEIQRDQLKGVRHFIINIPRQWGKSFLFKALVIHFGTRKGEPKNMLWVSQYLANARIIMADIVDMIQDEPFYKSSNKNDMKILFTNGSVLNLRGADNTKSIRGLSNEIIFLDEIAFYPNLEETWTKVIRPTTLTKKNAMVFMISTPNGRNYFWNLAMKGQNAKEKTYGYYSGRYTESPYVDYKELETAKRELPLNVYLQEYEAVFIDNAYSVFNNVDECSILTDWIPPIYGVRYFAGIDFGRRNDETVLTIMDDKRRICFIWKSGVGMTWLEIIMELIKHLKRYRVYHCFAESNSAGDPVIESLKTMFPRITGFYTTHENKTEIIESLRFTLDKKEIELPTQNLCPDLKLQLNAFTITHTRSQAKIRYTAPDGMHDDFVMSLCFALQSVKKHSFLGNYFIENGN